MSEAKELPSVTIDGEQYHLQLVRLDDSKMCHFVRECETEHLAAVLAALPVEQWTEVVGKPWESAAESLLELSKKLSAALERAEVAETALKELQDDVHRMREKRRKAHEPESPPPEACATCGGKQVLSGEEPGRGVVRWPCPDCAPRPPDGEGRE